MVPGEQFRGAFAWASIIFEAATILGPAVGGLIYGIFRTPSPVYATAMIAAAAAALSMLGVIPKFRPRAREPFSARAVLAGLHYIWREKMVLGSISLDMFAVLLGGAVYLLPAFASDILHTGPLGLGLLRCAPAIGAAVMALLLAIVRWGAILARRCCGASPGLVWRRFCSASRAAWCFRWLH